MCNSRTSAHLPLMVATCLAQETRASYVEDQTDSMSITILGLLQPPRRLLEVEAEALLLMDPLLLPSPVACLGHGSTLDATCEIFSNRSINTRDSQPYLNRDNAHGRVLSDEIPDNANMTVETCVGICNAANFTVAGIEFAVQCCQFFASKWVEIAEPYNLHSLWE
jgi:hypothetical protein